MYPQHWFEYLMYPHHKFEYLPYPHNWFDYLPDPQHQFKSDIRIHIKKGRPDPRGKMRIRTVPGGFKNKIN